MKIINRKALVAALIMANANGVLAMDLPGGDGEGGAGGGGSGAPEAIGAPVSGSKKRGRGVQVQQVKAEDAFAEVAPEGAGGAGGSGSAQPLADSDPRKRVKPEPVVDADAPAGAGGGGAGAAALPAPLVAASPGALEVDQPLWCIEGKAWHLAEEVEALREENSKAAECIDKSPILQGILISPELTQDNINKLIGELRKVTNPQVFEFFERNTHFNSIMLLLGQQKIYQQKLVLAFLQMEAESLEDFAHAVYSNTILDKILCATGRTCHDIYTIIYNCMDVFEFDKDLEGFINDLDITIQEMPDETIPNIVECLTTELFGSEDEADSEIELD